jgi:hypothetical protein
MHLPASDCERSEAFREQKPALAAKVFNLLAR